MQLLLRRVGFAFLLPGRAALPRDKVLEFYDRVAKAGVGINTLQHAPEQAVFSSAEERLAIRIGPFQQFFRFLIEQETDSLSLENFAQTADAAWREFAQTWPDPPAPSLVETSLILVAPTPQNNGTNYLKKCLGIGEEVFRALESGEPAGLGLRLILPLTFAAPEADDRPALEGATVEARIETFMQDPRQLFLQVVAKWPSIKVPPQVRVKAPNLPPELTPGAKQPAEFIRATYRFVEQRLTAFIERAYS